MSASEHADWEAVIGLEVHAQLLTKTKAFCACATSFGDPPNTHVCPVCLGLPGALPVLNEEAVRMATLAAIALDCTVHATSIFARKNYFYPDLPKGYQISQYDRPLATAGRLAITIDGRAKECGITRIHMEEDAGKNLHGVGDASIVDLNRAGTPLIEIVGEPDLRSSAEAAEYLKKLRDVLMFLGVNDGNLEQGSFRADANVSVRRRGDAKLGTRTELKNINSFRFVAEAIDVEIRRQIATIERGERVRQQTRGYNSDKKETYLLRDKENEAGYRYFPEPDLPPLVVGEGAKRAIAASRPRLPDELQRELVAAGLTPYAAGVLTGHPRIAAFFEAARKLGDAVKIGNFVQSEVLRDVRTDGLSATFPVTPEQVGELLALVDEGTISGKQAKEVYAIIQGTPRSPREVVREKGMAVLSDAGAIEQVARAVIDANPKQVAQYKGGKATMLGFFVGQIMKQTGGSASPQVVNDVLKRMLDDGAPPTLPGAQRESNPPTTTKTGEAPKAQAVKAPAPDAPPREPAAPAPAAVKAEPAISPAAASVPPDTELASVPFTEFAKLDLRVGLVVAASKVPKKDKLLDLRVDVGDASGPRRIVAGLALSFAPETLVGKRVIVVCNLEPRAFSKELVSHGMILAAGPSDALSLSTVLPDVAPGTKVK